MATIAEARKAAREAGVPVSEIRGLSDPEEVQAVIDRHTGKSRPVKKAVAKKKTTAKRTAVRKKVSSVRKAGTRKSASSKTAPARSPKRGTAKRQSTAKKTTAKRTATARRNSEGGRNTLNGVDYTVTEGWNPREDSAPDLILKALKRSKGNREKAFDYIIANYNLSDFVKRTTSTGRKRSKAEMEWQLRYRISRTAWDFAKRTGQHEPSQNRAVYGEGGTGIGVSGGMPVKFRPDSFDGKPTFKRAGSRKAAGASRTARKTTAKAGAKKRAAARSGAKKRSTASKRKATARGRK